MVTETREPGGTPLGADLRQILLSRDDLALSPKNKTREEDQPLQSPTSPISLKTKLESMMGKEEKPSEGRTESHQTPEQTKTQPQVEPETPKPAPPTSSGPSAISPLEFEIEIERHEKKLEDVDPPDQNNPKFKSIII